MSRVSILLQAGCRVNLVSRQELSRALRDTQASSVKLKSFVDQHLQLADFGSSLFLKAGESQTRQPGLMTKVQKTPPDAAS